MATHTKVRTSWVANQPVLHGEFAALDFGQFDSISCSGGTYAPASVITVGGAGMILTLVGTSTLAAAATLIVVSSAAIELQAGGLLLCDVGGFVGLSGSTSFNATSTTIFAAGSTTSLAGDFDMPASGVLQTDPGSTVLLEGSVTLGPTATMAVGCVSTFSATINAQAIAATAVSVSGPIACSGGVSITAASSLSSSINASGAGRFVGRVVKTIVSAAGAVGQTASPITAQLYYFPSAAASSTIQIDDTNAVDGDSLTFITAETTNLLVVKDPGGAPLFSIRHGGGDYFKCECTRIAGVWRLTGFNIT